MPKQILPLTELQVSRAKPKEKDYKLFDGGGLFLLIPAAKAGPEGKQLPTSKLWRFKYRSAGKEKLMAFGAYPAVSLSGARRRRDDAKELLANRIDPGEAKKAHKVAAQEVGKNTFEAVAREWHTKFTPTWSDSHAYWMLRRLEQYVFPDIGARPIAELKAPDVLKVLRRIRGILVGRVRHQGALILPLLSCEPLTVPASWLRKMLMAPPPKVAPFLRNEIIWRAQFQKN